MNYLNLIKKDGYAKMYLDADELPVIGKTYIL